MDPGRRLGLPDKPGIYRMLRSNGDVLYVGKALSLRRRVNSYFRKRTRHAEHILEMLTQAAAVDYTVTGSALEAAVRETDEIKRLIPPDVKESDQPVLTPESVVRVLESIVFRGAHVLRRARWFRLLSESSLAWSSADRAVPEKHLIVFEHGAIAYCTVLSLQESIPVPRGYKKRACDRLRRFDIMTCDRMRVVTTELRRLVRISILSAPYR